MTMEPLKIVQKYFRFLPPEGKDIMNNIYLEEI